jgi:hypothetical protein
MHKKQFFIVASILGEVKKERSFKNDLSLLMKSDCFSNLYFV